MKKYKIAIVGATGAVGREMLRCIFQFNFPFESIKLLASARSAGKIIEFENKKFTVEELTEDSFKGIDVAFWSAGGSISEKYVPFAVKAGCINIDNTSHFRMDPNVPLVVPEVNGEALRKHKGIIANPNCTTIQMVSALNRLNEYFDIERIIVSTYQAVSGAGVAGMEELYRQSQEILDGKEPVAKTLPCAGDKKHFPIAFNCIPQVDKFDLDNHFSKEEMKMVNETKKIFNKDIKVNDMCSYIGITRSYLTKIFKQVLHVSPYEYLLGVRMNKASLLLQTTALPVKQIAEMVGYKDALVFSKAFKQKIGSSPKAFRDSSGTLVLSDTKNA